MSYGTVEAATLAQHGPPPLARSPVSTCRAHYPGGPVQVRLSAASPDRAAFPELRAGRRPQLPFRGLLRLHSHYGPSSSLARPRRTLSQGFDPADCSTEPPASYRANRPLPGWDLHPQGDSPLRGAPEFRREGKQRFAQGALADWQMCKTQARNADQNLLRETPCELGETLHYQRCESPQAATKFRSTADTGQSGERTVPSKGRKNSNTEDVREPRRATGVRAAPAPWPSRVLRVSSLPAFGRPPWMKLSALPDLGYSVGAVGTKVGPSLVRQSPRVSWTRRPGRPPLARGSSDAPRARSLDVFFDQVTTPAASVWEEKGWTSFINV